MVWPSIKFVALGLVAMSGIVSGELKPDLHAVALIHWLNTAHPGDDEFIHPADVGRRQVRLHPNVCAQIN
jgi:hypothetical protein